MQYKIGARLGNYADVPALVIGEFGYAVDKKVMFVGDDTSTPPELITTKSAHFFEYPNVTYVKYNEIQMYDGGKVDGVDISSFNIADGFITRVQDGAFINRVFEHDIYIDIEFPDGVEGNPKFKASEQLLSLINNNTGGGGGSLNFFYGEEPPAPALPGTLFFSTIDELLYIYVTDGTTFAWIDIASVGGRGGAVNANRTFVGETPPSIAFIGDKFVDSSDDYRIYMRIMDDNGTHWREILSDQY